MNNCLETMYSLTPEQMRTREKLLKTFWRYADITRPGHLREKASLAKARKAFEPILAFNASLHEPVRGYRFWIPEELGSGRHS